MLLKVLCTILVPFIVKFLCRGEIILCTVHESCKVCFAILMFEFSAVNFIHYIIHHKTPAMCSKFECTYDLPYLVLPYTTIQCCCEFLKEKKK